MALVHLHRHGEYSLLDGLGTGEQYAARAVELGQEALAVTDHGTMSGVLYHVRACQGLDTNGNKVREAIKPIIGMEAYFRKDAKVHDKETNWRFHHLVLLAKNEEGFKNLMRLSSAAFQPENFYRKPCVDFDLLSRHRQGLIVTSGCPAGPVPSGILDGHVDDETFRWFLDTFRDDFYVEIQPHKWEGQKLVNLEMASLAQRHGVPLVATADSHYVAKEDFETHQVLIAISTNSTLAERAKAAESGEDVIFADSDSLYLMSEEEMRSLFDQHHGHITASQVDEAIANTGAIADKVEDYEISKAPKLPRATRSPLEAERIVREWCREGMERIGKAGDPTYEERLERELRVMRKREVFDYFVIVGRMVRSSKDRGIRVGPGRGSAAGSLVSYLSRITAIDPIGYDLVFERFMSEYRLELPDVDVDFQHTKRDAVKEELKEIYGHDHVTDVAAFSTFQMKSAVKDVGRAFDVPYDWTTRVSKEIEALTNRHQEQHLEDIAEASDIVAEYKRLYPDAWHHATRIEGQIKGISKHPAAVVITDRPVSEYMPTMRAADGENTVSQWAERADFHVITNYGFLKIDVLSIDGLTAQQHCIDLVRERHGVEVDFEDPAFFPEIESPFNADPDVLDFFGKGPYLGIHQFMSQGITQLLRDISPDSIDDIIAANALFRPGPIKSGICFEYPKLKNGKMEKREWHPKVAPYLERTHGLIVYQEQVMAIVAELGGFDPQESYIVFKSMTKWHVSKQRGVKGTEKLQAVHQKFIDGCASNGISPKEAEEIWDGIAAMSHYSFNRSHSAGYGLEAYQDAWLKVKYPLEFYASLLTWEKEKIPRVIREARNAGIRILPPDVNESGTDFVIAGNAIRFGLPAIKRVGDKAVEHIMEVREQGGPFASIEDFQARTVKKKANSAVVNALVRVGAFDFCGGRDGMDDKERAEAEKELIGFSLATGGISKKHRRLVEDMMTDDAGFVDGDYVFVGGEVIRVKEIDTRKGDKMAFVDLEIGTTESSVTFFPETYAKYRHLLNEGNALLVKGKWQSEKMCTLASDVCTVADYERDLKDAGRH